MSFMELEEKEKPKEEIIKGEVSVVKPSEEFYENRVNLLENENVKLKEKVEEIKYIEAERRKRRAKKSKDNYTIVLDGERHEDVSDEIESIGSGRDEGITNITQPTELGESLHHLNMDDVHPETRMSQIDLRSRLSSLEISYVLAVDVLIRLAVLPMKCLSLSTQKKRLVVSTSGLGRSEIVELVAGKREIDARKNSFLSGVQSFFGMGGGDKGAT